MLVALCAEVCTQGEKRRLITSSGGDFLVGQKLATVGGARSSSVEQQQKIVKTRRNSRAEFPFGIELRGAHFGEPHIYLTSFVKKMCKMCSEFAVCLACVLSTLYYSVALWSGGNADAV